MKENIRGCFLNIAYDQFTCDIGKTCYFMILVDFKLSLQTGPLGLCEGVNCWTCNTRASRVHCVQRRGCQLTSLWQNAGVKGKGLIIQRSNV